MQKKIIIIIKITTVQHYSFRVMAESCWTLKIKTCDSHGAGLLPGALLTDDVSGGEIFYF